MKEFTEIIELRNPDTNNVMASCKARVVLSWYLYPLVFVEEQRYLEAMPQLFAQQGLVQPALPHEQQKEWFKCLWSWKRYKKVMLEPLVANMEYYALEGRFANGVCNYEFKH